MSIITFRMSAIKRCPETVKPQRTRNIFLQDQFPYSRLYLQIDLLPGYYLIKMSLIFRLSLMLFTCPAYLNFHPQGEA
jgi:hypothetical protein